MQTGSKFGLFAATLASFVLPMTSLADAKCTRLAFSVNDYGKEGPTNDAKAMLDKYIAKWTADRGITGYTTGPKKVTCELYLDLLLFDEHTCKAEASVCWADASVPGETPPLADGSSVSPPAAAQPAEQTAAKPAEPAPSSVPAAQVVAPPAPVAPPVAAVALPPPSENSAVRTITPAQPLPVAKTVEATPSASSGVTTGSVSAPSAGAVVPPLEPDAP